MPVCFSLSLINVIFFPWVSFWYSKNVSYLVLARLYSYPWYSTLVSTLICLGLAVMFALKAVPVLLFFILEIIECSDSWRGEEVSLEPKTVCDQLPPMLLKFAAGFTSFSSISSKSAPQSSSPQSAATLLSSSDTSDEEVSDFVSSIPTFLLSSFKPKLLSALSFLLFYSNLSISGLNMV